MKEHAEPKDGSARFVAQLKNLAETEDRGALAALRRSLVDPSGMSPAACPYVVPFLPQQPDPYRDRMFFLAGALFATHSEDRQGISLGHAWRRVAIGDGEENPSARARFVALLDAHPDDVAEHLRYAVSLCRSKEVGLDWEQFLRDIVRLRDPERPVQRRWARHYWGAAPDEIAPADSSNAPEVSP